MKTFKTPKKSILLALALSFVCFGNASEAQTSYPPKEADSLYLYSALENKYSVEQLLNNEVEIPAEVSPEAAVALAPVTLLSAEEKARIQEERALADYAELKPKKDRALAASAEARTKIVNKGEIRSTVLGNNLGSLEFHLVQIKGLQAALNSVTKKISDVPLKLEIQDHVEVLKEEQEQLELVLSERSDKFSFIGWLVATI